MVGRIRLWGAGLLGAWLGCQSADGFVCAGDDECLQGGIAGTCETEGFCGFPDPDCPSGRRFGSSAASDLSGICVPLPADDASSGGTTTTTTSASTTGPLPTTTTTGGDTGPAGDGTTTGPTMMVTRSFGEGDGADINDVTTDAYLSMSAPGNNAGGHGDMHIDDGQVALLRFELTAIPVGAIVQSATLEVWSGNGVHTTGIVRGYRLLESWTEGDVDRRPGVCNWTERTASELWAAEGAGVGSRDAEPLIETFVADVDTMYPFDLPVAVVQGWVDDPASNAGIAFAGQGLDAETWYMSSETGNAARRPKLTVTWLE